MIAWTFRSNEVKDLYDDQAFGARGFSGPLFLLFHVAAAGGDCCVWIQPHDW
jgi:hypothetical protein